MMLETKTAEIWIPMNSYGFLHTFILQAFGKFASQRRHLRGHGGDIPQVHHLLPPSLPWCMWCMWVPGWLGTAPDAWWLHCGFTPRLDFGKWSVVGMIRWFLSAKAAFATRLCPRFEKSEIPVQASDINWFDVSSQAKEKEERLTELWMVLQMESAEQHNPVERSLYHDLATWTVLNQIVLESEVQIQLAVFHILQAWPVLHYKDSKRLNRNLPTISMWHSFPESTHCSGHGCSSEKCSDIHEKSCDRSHFSCNTSQHLFSGAPHKSSACQELVKKCEIQLCIQCIQCILFH